MRPNPETPVGSLTLDSGREQFEMIHCRIAQKRKSVVNQGLTDNVRCRHCYIVQRCNLLSVRKRYFVFELLIQKSNLVSNQYGTARLLVVFTTLRQRMLDLVSPELTSTCLGIAERDSNFSHSRHF